MKASNSPRIFFVNLFLDSSLRMVSPFLFPTLLNAELLYARCAVANLITLHYSFLLRPLGLLQGGGVDRGWSARGWMWLPTLSVSSFPPPFHPIS